MPRTLVYEDGKCIVDMEVPKGKYVICNGTTVAAGGTEYLPKRETPPPTDPEGARR